MKKLVLTAILAAAGLSPSAQTLEGNAASQPAGCSMKFSVHIDSILFISKGSGRGVVRCKNADGSEYAKAPVSIVIEGIGLGLGTFNMEGLAGSLGILQPSEINGTYAVVQATAGAGPALGAPLGFNGQQNGLSFTGAVTAGNGIGGMLNGTKWDIRIAR